MISRLLATAAIFAVSATSAMAANGFDTTIYGSNIDVSVSGFTEISHVGNSFTFSGRKYAREGNSGGGDIETSFLAEAHQGQSLTGKLSFTMEVAYQLDKPPAIFGDEYQGEYNAYAMPDIDVLVPACPTGCGPYDAKFIGSAEGFASVNPTGPTSGTWTITSNVNPASGNYNALLAYMSEYYYLDPGYGSFQINSMTLNFDTVDSSRPALASPVPELPPMAMFGAGILALGLHARLRKARAAKNVA